MRVLLVATLCKSGKAERLYQSEGLPYNLSIEEYCLKQGVPINQFNKWFKDTHKRIHPIQVDGISASMERDEMIRYIEFLQQRLDEEKRARELSDKRFEEESAARKEADKRVFDLLGKIDRMGEQHSIVRRCRVYSRRTRNCNSPLWI